MKNLCAVIFLCCLPFLMRAQPTNAKGWYSSKDLEDIKIGWISMQPNTAAKGFSQNGWTYPAAQVGYSNNLIQWLQQTYAPTGLLGEMTQALFSPQASLPVSNASYGYNQAEKDNFRALPNSYGLYAKMHKCLVKTATKKFWPMPGNHCVTKWNIMANNLELFTRQIVNLSSPDAYYFTQPRYTIGMKGNYENKTFDEYAGYRNFTNSANLKNYDHYYNPDFNSYTIIMTKDRQPLPFDHVTIGEFVSTLENRFPMMYKIAMGDGSKYPATRLDDAKKGFQLLKEKLKNSYNKLAYVNPGETFDFTWLYNIDDKKDLSKDIRTEETVKDGYGGATIYQPLLRLKKGVKEACATGSPQWIVFTMGLPAEMGFGGSVDMMDNFVSRYNYDYVYRYFFSNQKPAEPYKALDFATANDKKNELGATEKSAEAVKKANDKSVLFFEDFSGIAAGATPATWTTERSQRTGDKVTVVEINGVKGKWLKLKGAATPKNIGLPISGDFTASFDVLVHKGDVPWGTPGIEMCLENGVTKAGTLTSYKYNIDVSPGDMNRPDAAGWVIINQAMPAPYGSCKAESYYSISDFTGSRPVNKVTMSVTKKGESLSIYCNNKKVYSCENAAPSDISFKSFRFKVNEKNVYYISNILIKR